MKSAGREGNHAGKRFSSTSPGRSSRSRKPTAQWTSAGQSRRCCARDTKERGMRSATLLASLLPLAWAAVTPAADKPAGSQTVSVTGSQPAAKGPAEYFTGNARVEPLFAAKDTAPFSGAYVTFEPGARFGLAHASRRPASDRYPRRGLDPGLGRADRGNPRR